MKINTLQDGDSKVYKENPDFNSNKEPFGLTIKGKTRDYVAAHENIKEMMIKNKQVTSSVGKMKIVDTSWSKAMVSAIVEVANPDGSVHGEVELKVHNASNDKKKGATLEIRKLSDSEYCHVELLKTVIMNLLDKFMRNEDLKTSNSRFKTENEIFRCNICDWETRSEPALKGHKRRLHGKDEALVCDKCGHKANSDSKLQTHIRLSHKKEAKKRLISSVKCEECDSTFNNTERLNEHINSQHAKDAEAVAVRNNSLSSPPRKKLETIIESNEEMLELDSMEILVEKELNTKIMMEKRIKELEFLVEQMLEEKEQDKKCIAELVKDLADMLEEKKNDEKRISEMGKSFRGLKKSEIKGKSKHVVPVYDAHIPKLKGFKLRYKTIGDGACFTNAIAVHVSKDEKESKNIKRRINHHIADNFDNFYKFKLPLPYKETVGVGKGSKVVELETKEELLDFLRSEESLNVYSNAHDVLAAANLFNTRIHTFTYTGDEGIWSEVVPHAEMSSCAEFKEEWIPDIFLYHSMDNHFDLLVMNGDFLPVESPCQSLSSSVLNVENLLVEDETANKSQSKEVIDFEEEFTLVRGKNSGHRRTDPQSYAEKVKSTKKVFKCFKCEQELESQGLLDSHDRQKHERNFSCTVCQSEFQKRLDLEMHNIEEHETKVSDEWNCNDCFFQATNPSELMNHLKIKSHQPSPTIKDKRKVFQDYRRCYTCDLEVDGYVNLMNHRNNVHPSKKKCRNFPGGKCTWGKTCWYVHSEELMDVDESFKQEETKYNCYNCHIDFNNKDDFKKHKKSEHRNSVETCTQFIANKCERSEESCWFLHDKQSNNSSNQSPVKTVGFHNVSTHQPPDQFQLMMETIKNLGLKFQNMEENLGLKVQNMEEKFMEMTK